MVEIIVEIDADDVCDSFYNKQDVPYVSFCFTIFMSVCCYAQHLFSEKTQARKVV
jgi:hypothetical protein